VKTRGDATLTITRRQPAFAALRLTVIFEDCETVESPDSAVQAIPLINRVLINTGTAKVNWRLIDGSLSRATASRVALLRRFSHHGQGGTEAPCNQSAAAISGTR
jgi:hypothetical protein